MSMIGNFRRLPEADLRRLLEEPEQITDYLYEDAHEGFGPFVDLEIDKAWHGLHYLLTGTAWEGKPPLDFIVQGGREIGDTDVGYGPARGFTADEVRTIARALTRIDAQTLRARFNPQAMMAAEIYPDIWDRPVAEDDTLGYLVEHYEELRPFISDAAAAGEALLVYLN